MAQACRAGPPRFDPILPSRSTSGEKAPSVSKAAERLRHPCGEVPAQEPALYALPRALRARLLGRKARPRRLVTPPLRRAVRQYECSLLSGVTLRFERSLRG